jgi:NitT/TauT family transport system permease protein
MADGSMIVRPDYIRELGPLPDIIAVDRRLSLCEYLRESTWFRRAVVVLLLAAAWEAYGRYADNSLLFPTLSDTLQAFWAALVHGPLLERTIASLRTLVIAYAIGVSLAGLLVAVAVGTDFGDDVLSTLTAMFNPLPAIALLPLAMLWFGIGPASIIFVVVHSVLWAVALNAHSGFQAVSETIRMTGRNIGLSGVRYIFCLLVPAAFPSIVSGLKIGWAFAWRTLIAAELVFGATSRSGGLGWYIFENRNSLETPSVFAGLLTVILIGLLVESAIFRTIETRTVQRWGMQR